QAMATHPALDARTAIAAGYAALAFAVCAFAPQVLNDGDTFLHVAAGVRMIADHRVLFADPFSYTLQGAPWQAHEWFGEVLMAAAYAGGGWNGLLILFASGAATVAGFLAWQVGRWCPPLQQAVVAALALSCMTGSLLARPHLLALPLLVLWTAELAAARSERRPPRFWLLP